MKPALAALLLATFAFAQSRERIFETSGSVAIEAPPDEATVEVTVPTEETLDETLARLAPAGITREHLVSSSVIWQDRRPPTPGPGVFLAPNTFGFFLTIPADRARATQEALDRIGRDMPNRLGSIPPLRFRYSVNQVASEGALAAARRSAAGPLFESVRKDLTGMAAAIPSELGQVTRATLAALYGSGLTLQLTAERVSPFTARLVRVQVTYAEVLPLDEATLWIIVTVHPAVSRADMLARMVQAGLAERDLAQADGNTYQFRVTRPRADADAAAAGFRRFLEGRPDNWPEASVQTILGPSERAFAAARERSIPALLKDATAQAEALAALMGGRLGPLRLVQSAPVSVPIPQFLPVASASIRTGEFILGGVAGATVRPSYSLGGAVFEFYVE
ncbi:MAG: hypothetical protein R2729_25655 [Bryobacteraceae bacterium]